MKKLIILLLLVFVITITSISVTSAQTLSGEEIPQTFNKAILREQFFNKTNVQYYRFPKNIWYYDSLALSYFPSELVSTLYWEDPNNFGKGVNSITQRDLGPDDWALLGREMTGKAAKQMIYLDKPSSYEIIHGLDFPTVSYQDDFYLYTDLFLLDNYPENTGSCYIYFSNSILAGNRDSYGILIDPRAGIYKASNNYDTLNAISNRQRHYGYYAIGGEQHGLELIQELEPALYEGLTGSIGNDLFPIDNIDTKFNEDYEALKQNASKDGFTDDISVYRIELVRLNGITAVYINGIFTAEFEDEMVTDGLSYISNRNGKAQYITIRGKYVDLKTISGTMNIDDVRIKRLDEDTWSVYNPDTVNKLVSWTMGPILYTGGETVTMASGNLIIYGKK